MTTAVIEIQNRRGSIVVARALLDSCSTVNLITNSFAKSLNLVEQNCCVNIGAVGNMCRASNRYIMATFTSIHKNFQHQLNFLIVPKIAENVPNEIFPRDKFDIPRGLQLAGPRLHLPNPIDVLLASNTTLSVISVG